MKIAAIGLNGVRGLNDATLDLTDGKAPRSLVVVTGPTASGKSALLDAIAMAKEQTGPYGGGPRRALARPGGAAKVVLEWILDDAELAECGGGESRLKSESFFGTVPFGGAGEDDERLRRLLSRYTLAGPKMEYFHAARALPSERSRSGRVSAADRLTPSDEKYAGISDFLVEIGLGRRFSSAGGETALARFEHAFAKVARTRTWKGIVERTEGRFPLFEGPAGDLATLDELSDGEKQLILFVATFVRSQIDRSIVLIDGPELFLPEPDVARLVQTLAEMGDNQLIVATRSAELVASVPAAAVIRLGAA